MLTLDRDRQIVLSVDRFGQLAPGHISKLHFDGLASSEPMYRALRRLVAGKYLARIERRMVGGTGAGSGQWVYQLGTAGWKAVGRPGRYLPKSAISFHTLAIADAYVELLAQERLGRVEILTFETEPNSWRTVNGTELRPDLYVEVKKGWEDKTYRYWFETDMGTERREKIVGKLVDYYNAEGSLSTDDAEGFPVVVFLAPDDRRARELRHWIENGPKEAQRLFLVSKASDFADLLFS